MKNIQPQAGAAPRAGTEHKLTDLLTGEHRLIQRAVVCLARLCAHLRVGGELNAGAADDLLRFIREYADTHHHAKEEDILFPWMRSRGMPPGGGPIEVMLSEHTESRHHVSEMSAALAELRANPGAEDARARLVSNGEAYAILLWQHIWKEDNILYVMADQMAEGGTAGLYDPAADPERDTGAVEEEFGGLVEHLEQLAAGWPKEDLQWPEGCH